MKPEDVKAIRDRLLKEHNENNSYIDGILDFYNAVLKIMLEDTK